MRDLVDIFFCLFDLVLRFDVLLAEGKDALEIIALIEVGMDKVAVIDQSIELRPVLPVNSAPGLWVVRQLLVER